MSKPIWQAQVTGSINDLQFLAMHFTGGRLRVLSASRGDGFVIESEDFENITSAEEVLSKMHELLPVLSGVLRIHRGATEALQSNQVIRKHPDGAEEAFLYLHEVLKVRAESDANIVYADAKSTRIPVIQAPSQEVEIVLLALTDTAVAKAYRLIGKSAGASNWVDLYRIFEAIAEDLGGDHQTRKLGWVSEEEIRRFKHSANSVSVGGDTARHGRELTQPPSNPMNITEAESVVRRLLASWIEDKLRNAPYPHVTNSAASQPHEHHSQ